MIYLESKSNDPAYNTALELYAFQELAKEDNVFFLWINKPCIVVGKNQNTRQEIDQKYCDEHNIQIVRRVSGGGAVYHDYNNLNYTIISNEDSEADFDFKSMSQPVLDALADMGVDAQFTGRNDLQIGDQKFCGNAQYIKGKRVMHHGCMMFDVDVSVLSKALTVSKDKYESKGKTSVRSRVTNIKDHLEDKSLTVRDFLNKLREHMYKTYDMKEYILTEEDEEKIRAIKAEKNDSWDWVYGSNPDFNVQRKRKLPTGKVEANINVIHGIIEDIKFYGDFFGVKDVAELATMLKGTKYDRESILKVIDKVNIKEYFMGVSNEEAVDVLVD
ncbi:lipoate--protein ligase [Helcococcus kunzii]|uniref:lipoate--protein ligase n=1 Tax=Helcococcus kunzii ATCC 51366 TaxID=883114 RepID=H3NPY5_9FIRM|nr:lipoate--protein ligase [Helcococcus kunzii]EHR32665.1 lipoyltransferase and lipoate-protein ligase [Helcococcus kunzii ATCC 51366]MCT1796008.1 lipoate--protein ligase [Helcococcus kunzii]MCT1988216.1 lipoate--protein ligase [Helcococcus kunzii]QUY65289.1 lipoate--protein ligase [Helcococcus kunzii]QZO75945.1 lipoate--protein ligase [Helcococcus kunzii]